MDITLLSWNVNGLRAVCAKPDWHWFTHSRAHIIGLQETKAAPEQLMPEVARPQGWHSVFAASVKKKGYSGVATFSRIEPHAVHIELPDPVFQGEGRCIHLEFPWFHYCNVYFPNGGPPILDAHAKPLPGRFARLDYKMGYFESFLKYAEMLRRDKPLVVCGDFNIAHRPVDLARPKENARYTGFLPEERAFLDRFTGLGYIDTFRTLHGDVGGNYTWWSYQTQARPRNIGWRIDYFFVSEELRPHIADAWIEPHVYGSDHCPVGLTLRV